METVDSNQPQATIIVKRGGVETEETFTFVSPAVIGRFDPSVGPIDIDLGNLPEGAYVSRKHAKLTCEESVWKITDLGSSNGTYLLREDFERVEEGELADGTEFALGNARFVFRLSAEVIEPTDDHTQDPTEDPAVGDETNPEPSSNV